jgi:glyoxylase-like metal-dependent hydrolase (beta-lactamase superfamily II)
MTHEASTTTSPLLVHPRSTLPHGTRVQLLDLGTLEADAAFFFRGANTGTDSARHPHRHEHRELKLISALIEHPKHGLLLYDVGGAPDPETQWGEAILDVFPVREHDEQHRLDHAIAAAGHDIRDVKGVIIGHLHLDHAGGLEFFRDTKVPIYVQAEELKYAYFAVATGDDLGNYLPHYLDFGLNWHPISERQTELFPGLELYHTPGHSPGLQGLLVELENTGPLYFAGDQLIFAEHLAGQPQGWTSRDDIAWHDSRRRISRLVAAREAQIIFGHDPINFERFAPSPNVLD